MSSAFLSAVPSSIQRNWRFLRCASNLSSSLLGPPEADDIHTSTGGSTKPSDTGSAIVANLADLTKLGASETRLELAVDSAGCVLHVTRDT